MLDSHDVAIAKMYTKVATLGAVTTHASTSSGLWTGRGSGWHTAHDLAVTFHSVMANPVFAQITA